MHIETENFAYSRRVEGEGIYSEDEACRVCDELLVFTQSIVKPPFVYAKYIFRETRAKIFCGGTASAPSAALHVRVCDCDCRCGRRCILYTGYCCVCERVQCASVSLLCVCACVCVKATPISGGNPRVDVAIVIYIYMLLLYVRDIEYIVQHVHKRSFCTKGISGCTPANAMFVWRIACQGAEEVSTGCAVEKLFYMLLNCGGMTINNVFVLKNSSKTLDRNSWKQVFTCDHRVRAPSPVSPIQLG